MRNTDLAVKRKKSLAKGLIAGLAGGLAGTAAKMFAERIFSARLQGEPEPVKRLSQGFAGHELALPQKAAAAERIPWALGGAAGAVYGGLAEFYPAATAKRGANFGLVLATLTEEGALQGLGLAAEAEGQTMRGRTSEMTSYAVYGVVTEAVRRLVRWML